MMQRVEDWAERGLEPVAADKAEGVLAAVNPHFTPLPLSERATSVRARKLPFWQGWKLYAFTDRSTMPPVTKYALKAEEGIEVIDWTNAPIYAVNRLAPISLTADTVADYVRFFFAFVAGRHGRFLLVEDITDIPFTEEPAAEARQGLTKLLKPLGLKDSQDGWRLSALFLFQDSLFSATIIVATDGQVQVTDEKELIQGMPARSDFGLR